MNSTDEQLKHDDLVTLIAAIAMTVVAASIMILTLVNTSGDVRLPAMIMAGVIVLVFATYEVGGWLRNRTTLSARQCGELLDSLNKREI